MALVGTMVAEVRVGGSDTNNGGFFDFAIGNKSTNLAATSANTTAPVVTSASYNFVAADVGAWIYVAGGTNWIKGLYQIVSVASNAATLNATAGQYYLADTNGPYALGTVDGCATVASPTSGTWSVDYTQQDSAQKTYTDLVQASTTTLTSAANPFSVNQIGNTISITGGTGTWTTQRVYITNVSGTTATVDKTLGGSGGTAGTGGLGGAFATPGKVAGLIVSGMDVFIKYSATTYDITTASTNVAGGSLALSTGGSTTNWSIWSGYDSFRYLGNSDTNRPTIKITGAISSVTVINATQQYQIFSNLIIDCNSKSTTIGVYMNTSNMHTISCKVMNCTSYGILAGSSTNRVFGCTATGCSGNGAFYIAGVAAFCEAYNNTVHGFSAGATGAVFVNCNAYSNSGASTDGFNDGNGNTVYTAINCTAYGNGRADFAAGQGGGSVGHSFINCVSEGSGTVGWRTGSANDGCLLFNCAGYHPSGTNYTTTDIRLLSSFVAGSSSFFTNAGSADFRLTNSSLKNSSWPSTFRQTGLTNYLDRGYLQHADPSAGLLLTSRRNSVLFRR